MTTSESLTTGRTSFGKFLIRRAVSAGQQLNQLEASFRNSSVLGFVPPEYRRVTTQAVKLILLLAVASVALFLAVGIVALWTIEALSTAASNDDEVGVHEVSHPKHQYKYPELYDEHESLK